MISSPNRISFSLEATDPSSSARAGVLRTRRAVARTPIFMPVATHGVVRGQRLSEVEDLGFPILLANTYHLFLRPGTAVFDSVGGINQFTGWPRSILTDSGGFQLFSLSHSIKVEERGAEFTSYIDGRKFLLSPEVSIATQRSINSDIMMVLDHCLPSLSERVAMEEAMHLTHRWAARSLSARGESAQALFGIVQGGCFLDLRTVSAEQITSLPFDGFAIGGVAVGEGKSIREDIVEHTAKLLPKDRPRYLMGVGTPIDLLEGVARGIDMFDCIIPSALAEHGKAFTYGGRINLLRSVYQGSEKPIEDECLCSTCARHSRGYLHHLMKAGERVAHTLIGYHNLFFFHRLMSDMRTAIVAGTFREFYLTNREEIGQSEAEYPVDTAAPRAKASRTRRGDYEVYTRGESVSIRQISSGEVMHSVSDPLSEARAVYLEQSHLQAKLETAHSDPLCLWDVGLGAGTNAMAALLCAEELSNSGRLQRELHTVSFEQDLDSLALALRHARVFPYLKHPAPHIILKKGEWKSPDGRLSWTLLRGDFVRTMKDAPSPETIFFDPFSYKTDSILWSLPVFESIYQQSRESECTLLTYSASTAVRAALLASGFHVAYGAPTGPKESTTIATRANDPRFHSAYLGSEWLSRWERSDNRYPPLLSEEERVDFDRKVRGHPQFALVSG